MKTRLATLLILVPFLFACGKPNGVGKPDPPQKFAVDETVEEQTGNQEEENNQNPGEQEPEVPADAILVTNPYMDKYLEEAHYPEGDFTYILTFGSGNFRDHVEAYFLSIGVTSQEITEFRNLMLK